MRHELAELLAGLRSNLEFLRDIGVSGVVGTLPELTAPAVLPVEEQSVAGRLPTAASARLPRVAPPAGSNRPVEKYIPDSIDVPVRSSASKTPEKGNVGGENTKSRLNILSSARLADVAGRAAEKAEHLGRPTRPPEITESEKVMPKPKSTSSVLPPGFADRQTELPILNETIDAIRAEIGDCRRCVLHEKRTQVVHSTGSLQAKLMFIGEAPGADEDAKGEPFVGRAGQLLTKIIEAIGLSREEVFIGNINRCRPPGNRQPALDEAHTCRPFLLREIAVVRPKVIVVLGNTACHNLLDTKVGITKLRGIFQDYYGVKVMPTFHPAYLLRDPSKKRETWEDMKKVREYLNSLGSE